MKIPQTEYQHRRMQLMSMLDSHSAVLLPGAKLCIRNRDAEYPFRQSSDFLYLTGFPEPEGFLLLLPDGNGGGQSVLFCLPRDPEKETWNGYRYGPEGVVDNFNIDLAYNLDELDQKMVELLHGKTDLYYPLAQDEELSSQIQNWRKQIQSKHRSSLTVPQTLRNIEPLLHEMRLIKSPQEQAVMRAAGALSAEAHVSAMQHCEPGLMEYQLEAKILYCFADQGVRSAAYNTIVGGGANGCILHYTENRDPLKAGDLVLIDAGAEVDGYAGDITRTFPVNGTFTSDQRALYQLVLDAQVAAIGEIKPGASWNRPHEIAVEVLTEGLLQLGLLEGELSALIESEAYRPFYMHRTGHWLGLDVHDVGEYKAAENMADQCSAEQDEMNNNGSDQLPARGSKDSKTKEPWRALEPGMVLTVEPGLYIAPNCETVDPRWRGLGVRIEDDVLVTESGCEILTAAVPKTVEQIEALMKTAKIKREHLQTEEQHRDRSSFAETSSEVQVRS
nr:aminopeptidase P N-terminal domain-containing protein [Motiliproteus sp. MSK22-1]